MINIFGQVYTVGAVRGGLIILMIMSLYALYIISKEDK